MQITIHQAEIEEAIQNHIRSMITVRSDATIDIELRATRGADGFQAIIDVSLPKAGQPVQKIEQGNRSAQNVQAPAPKVEANHSQAESKAEPLLKAVSNEIAEGAVTSGELAGRNPRTPAEVSAMMAAEAEAADGKDESQSEEVAAEEKTAEQTADATAITAKRSLFKGLGRA